MRFFINSIAGQFEVIGMAIDLPNTGSEICVVHNAPFRTIGEDKDGWSPYGVSHAGTGCRISWGDTIDEAIENARKKMDEVGADGFQAAIKRASEYIASKEAA